MVYAFLIHTCDKNARPLYSQFFTPEGNDRLMQERSAHFVAVVNREFQFRMASRHSDGFKELETLAGTPASSKSTSGVQVYVSGAKVYPVRHSQKTSDKSSEGMSQAFSGQGPCHEKNEVYLERYLYC